jgi:hypothetical protein
MWPHYHQNWQVLPIRLAGRFKSTACPGDEVGPAAFDAGAFDLGFAVSIKSTVGPGERSRPGRV